MDEEPDEEGVDRKDAVRPAPPAGGPVLHGRRILVTRAEDQGEGLARTLEALGARVIWIPAIRTEPVRPDPVQSAPLDHMGTFRWVAFTSPNGVRHFLALLKERGVALPTDARVAAVGAATGRALEEAGIAVHAMPREATGRALAEHLVGTAPPSRLLLPRGRKGREELPEMLAAAGWDVVPVVCYDTLPAAVTPEAAEAVALGMDAALFASPSAAQNLWAVLDEVGREALSRTLLIPIGPTTARALEKLGLKPEAPPEDHTVTGLVSALLRALEPLETGP